MKENSAIAATNVWYYVSQTKGKIETISELLQANLEKLAELWAQGHKIAWDGLYRDKKPFKISLPTYPFAKRRCWIESTNVEPPKLISKMTSSEKNVSIFGAEIKIDRSEIIHWLLEKCGRMLALEISEIDPEIPFQNYGMDSIIGINFIAEFNVRYPELFSPMDLYRYPTLNSLADFVVESVQPTEEKPVAINEASTSFDIDKLVADIQNLSDAEVAKLLEEEMLELDGII